MSTYGTKAERRIAVNIVNLPDLLRRTSSVDGQKRSNFAVKPSVPKALGDVDR
jgi:hypothetical protein